jgi:hypothetical protein
MAIVAPSGGLRTGTATARAPAIGLRSAAALAAVGVLYAVALASRNPGLLTDPTFFAEDGQNWFADAHNLSALHALLSPLGGYYELLPRLVALLLAPLGLRGAAVGFACVGLCVQVAPALLFASRRFRHVVASDRVRWLLSAAYLCLWPSELTGNLTASQWHLAVLAFLVLGAKPPHTRGGRCFDITALAVAGLTGPYALFLAPLGFVMHRRDLTRWRWTELGVLAVTAAVQLTVLAFALPSAHRAQVLGASASDLVFAVTNQVLDRFGHWGINPAALPLAAAGAAAVALMLCGGFLRGPRLLRHFIVFAVAVAASGMLTPYSRLPDTRSAWDEISTGGGANRYFVYLVVAVVCSALVLLRRARLPRLGLPAGALVCALVLGSAAVQWRFPQPPSQHLAAYEAELSRAVPGTVITIPITPRHWDMQVIAR